MKLNSLILSLIPIIFLSCDIESNNNPASNIEYNTQVSIGKENDLIYIEIYDYPKIAGFQFDIHLSSGNLQINTLSASGGLSEEANFTVSTGLEMLRVLGFNLNGETINSAHLDSNRLVYLNIETNGSGLIGLQNVIISGENGYDIPVNINPILISIP